TQEALPSLQRPFAGRTFLLYFGTQAEPCSARSVAANARAVGLTVTNENGPFGTVVVAVENGFDCNRLLEIDGVTSFCAEGTAEEERQSLETLELLAQLRT